MADKIEWEGSVKHDETSIGGKLGFYVHKVKNGRITRFLDKITPSWLRLRHTMFSLPVDPEEAEDWEVGDQVKITIEQVEGENW